MKNQNFKTKANMKETKGIKALKCLSVNQNQSIPTGMTVSTLSFLLILGGWKLESREINAQTRTNNFEGGFQL